MVGTTMYNILYEKSIPWELPLKFQEYIKPQLLQYTEWQKRKEKYSYSIKVWFLIKNSDCFNF